MKNDRNYVGALIKKAPLCKGSCRANVRLRDCFLTTFLQSIRYFVAKIPPKQLFAIAGHLRLSLYTEEVFLLTITCALSVSNWSVSSRFAFAIK